MAGEAGGRLVSVRWVPLWPAAAVFAARYLATGRPTRGPLWSGQTRLPAPRRMLRAPSSASAAVGGLVLPLPSWEIRFAEERTVTSHGGMLELGFMKSPVLH